MTTAEATLPKPSESAVVVKGPTALGNDPKRLLRLAYTLAVTDFKLRFFGSVLGYLWTLMRPLMLFGVLYLMFSEILKFAGPEPHFAAALLLGVVLYQFLQEATSQSVRSLAIREHLVRKIDFPRLAVPLASVMLASFNLALNLIVAFGFLIASGATPMLTWLELPLILVYMLVLALGPAMLLSALYVRYRDVEPIWDVTMQITFYITPIFFTLGTLREQFKDDHWVVQLLMSNPFAIAVQQMRHALVDHAHPSAAQAVGSRVDLLLPFALVAFVFVLGFWYFNRRAPQIAEDL